MEISRCIKEKFDIKIKDIRLMTIEEHNQFLLPENRTYSSWWWLKTKGEGNAFLAVNPLGEINPSGMRPNVSGGDIKPVIVTEGLKCAGFNPGDTFVVDCFGKDAEFLVLDDTLAWMHKGSLSNEGMVKEVTKTAIKYEDTDAFKLLEGIKKDLQ